MKNWAIVIHILKDSAHWDRVSIEYVQNGNVGLDSLWKYEIKMVGFNMSKENVYHFFHPPKWTLNSDDEEIRLVNIDTYVQLHYAVHLCYTGLTHSR